MWHCYRATAQHFRRQQEAVKGYLEGEGGSRVLYCDSWGSVVVWLCSLLRECFASNSFLCTSSSAGPSPPLAPPSALLLNKEGGGGGGLAGHRCFLAGIQENNEKSAAKDLGEHPRGNVGVDSIMFPGLYS